jgi:hypothetical protein
MGCARIFWIKLWNSRRTSGDICMCVCVWVGKCGCDGCDNVSQPASHPPTLPFITTNNTSRSLQDFALVAVERVTLFLDRQQRLDDKAQHKHKHDKTQQQDKTRTAGQDTTTAPAITTTARSLRSRK